MCWLAVALFLLLTLPARAHDIYTSLAEAKLLPDKLEITLTLARSCAHDLLPNSRTLPPITPETFSEFEPRLRAAASELFEIAAGGKPLALNGEAKVALSGDADVTFTLNFPRPPKSPVRFFARYLGHLVDGHVGTLIFTDAAGSDFGWSPVSIDMPTFEASLPDPKTKKPPAKK